MGSIVRYITEQPFVRYMREQPLHTPAADAEQDALVHDAPAPAPAPAAPAVAPPAPNAHPLANVEKTWLADKARKTASIGGWMSAIRLVSNNTPLLAVPGTLAAKAVDTLAVVRNPAGICAFAVKDIISRQLEHLNMDTTYITRLARLSARGAASAWYLAQGLSKDDVRAWMSRPDYEYPADCDPHDLSPTPNPHCPVLAVGQLAERIEPAMGALLIGMMGLSLAWALYRLDMHLHRRPPAAPAAQHATPAEAQGADLAQEPLEPNTDVEAGVRAPLLGQPPAASSPRAARAARPSSSGSEDGSWRERHADWREGLDPSFANLDPETAFRTLC